MAICSSPCLSVVVAFVCADVKGVTVSVASVSCLSVFDVRVSYLMAVKLKLDILAHRLIGIGPSSQK